MKRKITIDPGIGGSGYAVWNEDWSLSKWGEIMPIGKTDFEKLDSITSVLRVIARTNKVEDVYIEYPATMRADIAMSGALTKLGFGAGVLIGSLLPRRFELVSVRTWKGNLPKEVVAKRVQRAFPAYTIDGHAYDAIGVGLFLRGDF